MTIRTMQSNMYQHSILTCRALPLFFLSERYAQRETKFQLYTNSEQNRKVTIND